MTKRFVLKLTEKITLVEPLSGKPFERGGKVLEPLGFKEFAYRLLMSQVFAETIDGIRSAKAIYEELLAPGTVLVLEEIDWARLVLSAKSPSMVIPYSAPVLWQLMPFFDAILNAEVQEQ